MAGADGFPKISLLLGNIVKAILFKYGKRRWFLYEAFINFWIKYFICVFELTLTKNLIKQFAKLLQSSIWNTIFGIIYIE